MLQRTTVSVALFQNINSNLPQLNRKQRMQQMVYQCQSVVNSCSFNVSSRKWTVNASLTLSSAKRILACMSNPGKNTYFETLHLQGNSMAAYQCCQAVSLFVPTMNGLCWTYFDSTLLATSNTTLPQFIITFTVTCLTLPYLTYLPSPTYTLLTLPPVSPCESELFLLLMLKNEA